MPRTAVPLVLIFGRRTRSLRRCQNLTPLKLPTRSSPRGPGPSCPDSAEHILPKPTRAAGGTRNASSRNAYSCIIFPPTTNRSSHQPAPLSKAEAYPSVFKQHSRRTYACQHYINSGTLRASICPRCASRMGSPVRRVAVTYGPQ